MKLKQFLTLASLLVAMTFVLAAVWKFGLEELADPYLAGDHQAESDAERWEFVVVSTLLVALVTGMLMLVGRRALQALEQRQWLDALLGDGFEANPVASFAMDGERRIHAENASCRALLGPYFGGLVGRSFHDLLPIDLTDTRYLELEMALRDQARWEGALVLDGVDGPVRLSLDLVLRRDPGTGTATSLHAWVHALKPLRHR
jgi:PAS domain-containing protein